MAYEAEINSVERAIATLKQENDPALIAELEEEQRAAFSGLEFYGITKTVFERFLRERTLKRETQIRLDEAIKAIGRIYAS